MKIILVKVIQEKLHPLVPSVSEWPTISEIMEACFFHEAANRPTFESICKQLMQLDDNLLKSIAKKARVSPTRETKEDIRKISPVA